MCNVQMGVMSTLSPDGSRSAAHRLLGAVHSRGSRTNYVGVPMPKGVAFDVTSWGLVSAQGRTMPVQIRVLDLVERRIRRWASSTRM